MKFTKILCHENLELYGINFVQFMTAPAVDQNPASESSLCLQHKSWKVCSIQNTLGMFSLSTCE